jgi:hypothetical protein
MKTVWELIYTTDYVGLPDYFMSQPKTFDTPEQARDWVYNHPILRYTMLFLHDDGAYYGRSLHGQMNVSLVIRRKFLEVTPEQAEIYEEPKGTPVRGRIVRSEVAGEGVIEDGDGQ